MQIIRKRKSSPKISFSKIGAGTGLYNTLV